MSNGMLALLKRVTVFANSNAQVDFISGLTNIKSPTVLSFLNQHAFNVACSNTKMSDALQTSDILLRDGVGIEFGMKLLGLSPGINCNGTDIIPMLLNATRGQSVAVFGTQEPWLSRACAKMSSSGVLVIDKLDGFQPESKYLEHFEALKPDIIVLAMGMPKQEILSSRLRVAAQKPCIIINGGAIIDFIAGKVPRAPSILRTLRLEWLFRLACEPSRLANRYLIGGPVFFTRVGRLWFHRTAAGPANADIR